MRWLKWLGLAGLLGAAAASVVVVQRQRARSWTELSTDDLREKLHARLAASQAGTPQQRGESLGAVDVGVRRR